ncbi:glycoside hydrolase family 26 protein [Methylomagnum sp.]
MSTASWVRDRGSVPFIRIMLRDSPLPNRANRRFTLSKILRGQFDTDFLNWARAARDFNSPLLVEVGTEMNGRWFPWNGKWNGAGIKNKYGDPRLADGPERFRDAYRRIITLMREEGANNIGWVFHPNNGDYPATTWNRFENYYPGDEYIDLIGVSVYGALTPMSSWSKFRADMDLVYPRLARLSAAKPLALLEFGVTSGNKRGNQAVWADAALADIVAGRWPRLVAFSWWNETWENDDIPRHNTDMRVQTNPALAEVFRNRLAAANILDTLGSSTVATASLQAGLVREESVTLAPGAKLPSEADCAARVAYALPEWRPQNAAANLATPTQAQLQSFHQGAHRFFAPEVIPRITGNFTGTTDEILQWAACKWGFDAETERAVAMVESDWLQATLGDWETDNNLCPPDRRNSRPCPTSFGLLQVKYEADSAPAYPMTRLSTAFNVDYKLGRQYACYRGWVDYLRERMPTAGYPVYTQGTDEEMYWGCVGWHYSGGWYDPGAIEYIQLVKEELRARRWRSP